MPRTLYVHIGPMKTGTSAVQSLLSKHDDSAILYPKVGLWGPGSHHGLVYSFFGETVRGRQPHGNVMQLFQEIAASAKKSDRNVLISSEMFVAPPGRKHHRNLAAFVCALLQHFDGDWRVEVLFTCRDHLERAASVYSQRVKGRESIEQDSPDEFLLKHIDDLQYAPMARAIREFGFHVVALSYNPAQSWTSRFLAHVGVPPDEIPESQPKNISLSIKALIAKLSANRTLRTTDERHRFLKFLKQMPGYYAPSQLIFGPDAVARAEQQFSVDRNFLRRECGIQLPDRAPAAGECLFFIDSEALSDISNIARRLGAAGNRVVEAATEYLRTSQ